MEDAIVHYASTLNPEGRTNLIKYMSCWMSPNYEEYSSKRKAIGVKKLQAVKIQFMDFLMRVLPLEEALKKIEVESQSHST